MRKFPWVFPSGLVRQFCRCTFNPLARPLDTSGHQATGLTVLTATIGSRVHGLSRRKWAFSGHPATGDGVKAFMSGTAATGDLTLAFMAALITVSVTPEWDFLEDSGAAAFITTTGP